MLFKIDSRPASTDELSTSNQLTSSSTAVVPMVAIAVWHKVRNALTRAAFQKDFMLHTPKKNFDKYTDHRGADNAHAPQDSG